MDLLNLMEDKVIQVVSEICDEEEQRGTSLFCTTEQCRTDVACFVLNRIPQRYVSSGRGFAYLESDLNKNMQIHVDLVTLVHEGLQRVSDIQRSFYHDKEISSLELEAADSYIFPLIKGRLFSASNFEPLSNGLVRLSSEGKPLASIDGTWTNPYPLMTNNPGTFLFRPESKVCPNKDKDETIELTLSYAHDDFEAFSHTFSLVLSRSSNRSPQERIAQHDLGDLLVIPKAGDEYEMQLSLSDPDEPT